MKPPVKWKRVLEALLTGRSWNRYEAAGELSDHCLHSTISTIQKKGVPVSRRTEKLSGYMGVPTDCCRYWLEPKDFPLALAVLAAKRSVKAGRVGGGKSPKHVPGPL